MNKTWENGQKPNYEPNFDPILGSNFFSWVLLLLVVVHCSKLSSYASETSENGKKSNFGANFDQFGPRWPLSPKFYVDFTSVSS